MRFSDEFLSEVKDRNDIVDVISPYVDLRIRGRTATGLCPFHNEKTPSFTVYLDTQSYYCFGCGAGGDVITFVKTIESLDYTEAVKALAERSGLPLPADGFDSSIAKMKRRILDANREAARFFYKILYSPEGRKGLDYFTSRNLSKETITHFGLGFAPDRWDGLLRHLKSMGFTEAELIAANLAKKTQKGNVIDVFRNRVMFPIIDLRGSVIAFGGRVLDDSKPKYVNTSDTLVYKKSQGVFALNFAKRGTGKTLILCEGYMDVIAYHQAGFTNAVAGLGTAFTPEQAKLLSKYGEEIILSYDSDEAGQKAARKAVKILSATPVRIKVARLQGGKDPDEILKKYGKEKMREILSQAVGEIDFDLQRIKADYDLSQPEEKIAYLGKATDILSDFSSSVKRDVYASKLSSELGVSKDAIEAEIKKKARQKAKRAGRAFFEKAAVFTDESMKRVNPERQKYPAAAKAEETLIASILHNPDFYYKIRDKINDDDFATSLNLRIYRLIAARLEERKSTDITYFSQDLSPEEMGYLVRLEAMRENLGNTLKECTDCIKRMKEEKEEREQKKPSQMTDDEWLNMFKRKNDQ